MNRWIEEDWRFELTVLSVRAMADGKPECRCGHEAGDCFGCEYACPANLRQRCCKKRSP